MKQRVAPNHFIGIRARQLVRFVEYMGVICTNQTYFLGVANTAVQ